MRIISGSQKGRPILPPADATTTRPITDRAKEHLFNRLTSLGALYAEEGFTFGVLDVFAGTGSLGLEALSRGADHCTFVETDRDARQRLEQNLIDLNFRDRSTLATGSALSPAWVRLLGDESITLAFLDPPYRLAEDPVTADTLRHLLTDLIPKLQPAAIVVYRTPDEVTPPEAEGLDGPQTFTHGSMAFHYYQKPFEAVASEAEEGEADVD